jgi:hypothetical protein
MNRDLLTASIRAVVRVVPDVLPLLPARVRYSIAEPTEYKTYEFFLSAIQGLVAGVYYNNIGGIFIDTLANLISGQLTAAYMSAWMEEGHFTDLPAYLQADLENMILQQYDFIDQFFRDIIDARLDGLPLEPLMYRAQLWANQYNSAYNRALLAIEKNEGGKLMWVEGDTGKKCPVCLALDGIVAYASEWDLAGVRPQSPPNPRLGCGGWRCLCKLVPTKKRRTPKAFDRIMEVSQ